MLIPKKFDYEILYYLSGPMTGYPNFNYEAFDKTAVTLRKKGIELISPHELFSEKPGELAWTDYMKKNITSLMGCNGLLQLKGWPKSAGAFQEFILARNLNYPIWYLGKDSLIEIC